MLLLRFNEWAIHYLFHGHSYESYKLQLEQRYPVAVSYADLRKEAAIRSWFVLTDDADEG